MAALGIVFRAKAIPSALEFMVAPTTRRYMSGKAPKSSKSSKPPKAPKAAQPPTTTVKDELLRVGELRRRAGAENSRSAKASVVAEYSDLRELLEIVYDPSTRFGVKAAQMKGALDAKHDGEAPSTLTGLFRALAAREPGDPSARGLIARFLEAHGVVNGGHLVDPALWDEFARLLDRNLKAGFAGSLLNKVPWKEAATEAVEKEGVAAKAPQPEKDTAIPRFSCALGKPIHPPFQEVFSPGPRVKPARWFASRKLDGVRCLAVVDVQVAPESTSIVDVRFVSRAGNEFKSLSRLERQLEYLSDVPAFRGLVDRDTPLRSDASGALQRIVLDGEVCLFREDPPDEIASSSNDWATPAMGDVGVEDFNETVSWMRRLRDQMPDPHFFLFDVLSWSEVMSERGARVFSERAADAQALAVGLAHVLEEQELRPYVRALSQTEVTSAAEVERLTEHAAKHGWEGIILRADRGYKGKRSADIYKCKRWQDAEYTVESVDVSRQRLAVNGLYGEHDACASVWITHDGVRVSVGTGFTTEQRLRYGLHPEDIIGKQVTVEFFTESSGAGRDKEQKSLRFPRIKHVWEEGKREI